MRISSIGALAFGLVALAGSVPAQGGTGWRGIGRAPAVGDSAAVTIAARGESRDRELMFCVEGHAMRLQKAELEFEGGGKQTMRISERVADGACSAGKTLSGRSRAVRSAQVTYDPAVLAGGTAEVQLFVR